MGKTVDVLTAVDAQIVAEIGRLNAAADAARPTGSPSHWPERDSADQVIPALNQLLVSVRAASQLLTAAA